MKGKAPKEIRNRRDATHASRKDKKADVVHGRFDWKFWSMAVVSIVGLVGLLGLITLIPRPTVAIDAPLDPGNIMTSRFEVSNDGYFKLHDLRISSFVRHAEYENRATSDRLIVAGWSPPTGTLNPDERETIPFLEVYQFPLRIRSADIAVIVFFRPIASFAPEQSKVFRFRTVTEADGRLRFEPQPPDDTKEQYNTTLKAIRQRAEGVRSGSPAPRQ